MPKYRKRSASPLRIQRGLIHNSLFRSLVSFCLFGITMNVLCRFCRKIKIILVSSTRTTILRFCAHLGTQVPNKWDSGQHANHVGTDATTGYEMQCIHTNWESSREFVCSGAPARTRSQYLRHQFFRLRSNNE